MSKRQILAAAGTLMALLALTAGLSTAQGPGSEPTVAERDLSLTAMVDSTISYQGMLTDGGSPVSGSRTMVFRLFSDGGCTTQVGTDINAGTVQVSEGYFDVALPVDHDDFDGQALWIEVEVGTTEIGCEPIRPVPYALSLKPMATISGDPAPGEAVLTVSDPPLSRAELGRNVLLGTTGVYGEADVDTFLAAGVHGVAAGDGSLKYGVWGQTSALTGRAVFGEATSSSGTNYGIYGATNSDDGYAGYFDGDVGQGRTDSGLVKASALVYCSSVSTVINRSFNNVGAAVTGTGGGAAGRCLIDFNFDVTDRYWSATSAGTGTSAVGVSCSVTAGANDQMQCQRWLSNGTFADGLIMVVVY